MMKRVLDIVVLATMVLATPSCAQSPENEAQQVRTMYEDTNVKNGLKIQVPWEDKGFLGGGTFSLGLSVDDLKNFLKTDKLPLPKEAIKLIKDKGCQDHFADFVVEVSGYGVPNPQYKREKKDRHGFYADEYSPGERYGFINMGPQKWSGHSEFESNHLFLKHNNRPYGFIIECGVRRGEFLNCKIDREIHKYIRIEYSTCSEMLPYLEELDALYFTLLQKIIITPKLTSDYRLKK